VARGGETEKTRVRGRMRVCAYDEAAAAVSQRISPESGLFLSFEAGGTLRSAHNTAITTRMAKMETPKIRRRLSGSLFMPDPATGLRNRR
jgi:hypothetical protein